MIINISIKDIADDLAYHIFEQDIEIFTSPDDLAAVIAEKLEKILK